MQKKSYINLLLTKCECRSGEYWPEVMVEWFMSISTDMVHMAKSQPRKNQSQCLNLPQDYLSRHIKKIDKLAWSE